MAPSTPIDPAGDTDVLHRRFPAMAIVREPITPWLGAAAALAVLALAMMLFGPQLGFLVQSAFLVATCASLVSCGLIAARTNQEHQETIRAERARPAAEELTRVSSSDSAASYISGMERWTTRVLELLEHALSLTEPGTPAYVELDAAASETRDLRGLFDHEATDELTINDRAVQHALGTLWTANQARIENLAAAVDPAWHRRWRARSVVERELRNGHERPEELVLPYADDSFC